jgi:hypothetical protein
MILAAVMAENALLTPRRWAIASAAAVLVSGFLVLNVLFKLGLGQPNLAGLYTFRSATVGDGVLLPLLAYSLVRSCGLTSGWNRTQRQVATLVMLGSAVVGVALQIQLIANPHPRLNWTLPAPHTLNLPGWYHAAFLVAACGFFGGVAALVLLRIREEADSRLEAVVARVRSTGAVGVLAPAIAFAGLLAEDNAPASRPEVLLPIAAVATVGLLFLLVLCWAAGRTQLRWCALASIAATLPALGIAGLFIADRRVGLLAVLSASTAGFVGAFASTVLGASSRIQRIVLALCAAACAAGPVYVVAAAKAVSIPQLATGWAVSTLFLVIDLVVMRSLLPDASGSPLAMMLLPLAVAPMVAFALIGRYFSRQPSAVHSYGTTIGYILAAFFLLVAARVVRLQFDPVIAAEKAPNASALSLSLVKWRGYLAAASGYVAALFAYLAFVIGENTATSTWIGGRAPDYLQLLEAGLILAGVLAAAWTARAIPSLKSAERLTTLECAAACLVWIGLTLAQLTAGYRDWPEATLSILVALVCGLFVFESVLANVGYLHNIPMTWRSTLIAATSALAVGSTAAWMTGPSLESATEVTSVGFGLGSLAIGSAAIVLMPFLCARVLPEAMPARLYVINSPPSGVLQDAFMALLIAVSVAWLPNFFLSHLKGVNLWLPVVLSYLAILSTGYYYILRNNVTHVQRERQRINKIAEERGGPVSKDEEHALQGLARHVRHQNVLALTVLFPLGIWAIGWSGFEKGAFAQLVLIGDARPVRPRLRGSSGNGGSDEPGQDTESHS